MSPGPVLSHVTRSHRPCSSWGLTGWLAGLSAAQGPGRPALPSAARGCGGGSGSEVLAYHGGWRWQERGVFCGHSGGLALSAVFVSFSSRRTTAGLREPSAVRVPSLLRDPVLGTLWELGGPCRQSPWHPNPTALGSEPRSSLGAVRVGQWAGGERPGTTSPIPRPEEELAETGWGTAGCSPGPSARPAQGVGDSAGDTESGDASDPDAFNCPVPTWVTVLARAVVACRVLATAVLTLQTSALISYRGSVTGEHPS